MFHHKFQRRRVNFQKLIRDLFFFLLAGTQDESLCAGEVLEMSNMSRLYDGEYICNADNGVGLQAVRQSVRLTVLCKFFSLVFFMFFLLFFLTGRSARVRAILPAGWFCQRFWQNFAYFLLIFRLFSAYGTPSAVFKPTCL